MNSIAEHEISSTSFDQIIEGGRTYELCSSELKYKSGDRLELVEIDIKTQEPTGRRARRKIGYIGDIEERYSQGDKQLQVMSLLEELPTIRIKDAWLLREHASTHLHELWGEGKELADDKWMKWKVGEYKKAWEPYEQRILLGMTETLGLSFRQNIIDVNIAPWFHAFSDPLVIGVMQDPDVFIDTLTHELLHRLLTDNTTIPYEMQTDLIPEWRRLFGKGHTFTSLVHIPVHAIHKAIYLDVLKEPKRLERDIANNEQYEATDYMSAWSYVDKIGYKKIIKKLRGSYLNLSTK